MNVFEGTAEYYNLYRPGVPEELVHLAIDATGRHEHLLDLGTGTGQVLAQFVPHFDRITAVGPDESMLEFARQRLGDNITFIHDTAEKAEIDLSGEVDLVTIAHMSGVEPSSS